jgi:hypothetical protein
MARQTTNSSSQDLGTVTSTLRLFVGVLSSPTNLEARQTIRATWGSDKGITVLRFFVLRPQQDAVFKQLRHEAANIGDVVITSGVYNDYYNITYAVLDLFRTAAVLGDAITHVMKVDDDCYVRMPLLLPALDAMPSQWLYAGWPMVPQGVVRTPGWHHVPYKNWPRDDPVKYGYGWGYVVSRDFVQHIAAGAPHVIMPAENLLIIEDVAVAYWIDFVSKDLNVTTNIRVLKLSETCREDLAVYHIKGKPKLPTLSCMHNRQGACC